MKEFSQFSRQHRPVLEKAIKSHIDLLCNEVLSNSQSMGIAWQKILNKKLIDYAWGGKMLRGLLTLYWAYLYGFEVENDTSLFSVAASLELLQMFLLIHDDIMDRDDMRRNMSSMHVQLTKFVHASSIDSFPSTECNTQSNLAHTGEALAICVGDIVFSHAVNVIHEAMPLCRARRALHIFSSYVSKVGLAQMYDMYWESSSTPPSKEAILAMYEGKTGHYTFTLPALMGYLYLSGFHDKSICEDELMELVRLGGLMGQVFQIHDDVLDIRYPASVIGKPRGSDCMKKKRTFFQWQLFQCAAAFGKRAELQALWIGDIKNQEIDIICKWAEEWGVYDEIKKELDELLKGITVSVSNLSINLEAQDNILSFVQHLTEHKL